MNRVPIEGSRILITGATGQFAKPLVSAYAATAQVFAAARYGKQEDHDAIAALGAIPVRIDLSHPESLSALPDVEYVINAAVAKSGDFERDLRDNAEGVGHLMAKVRNARAFLHISTTGVYAYEGHRPRKENDALGDNHRAMFPTYSIAKIAAECVVRFAAAAFDLPAIIARMSVPYGDDGGWPYFHLLAMQNHQPIMVHPERPNFYNPLHVDDYIEKVPYLLGAASSDAMTTNLGGSQMVALEEWCAHIGERTGLVPIFEEQANAFGSLAIDTTLMHALIGETRVDWRDGIDRMLRARLQDGIVLS